MSCSDFHRILYRVLISLCNNVILNPVAIRAIYIVVDKDLNKHLSIFRMLHEYTEEKDRRVIDTKVINIHHKPYAEEIPLEADGFTCIDTVEFRPMKFDDEDSESLFRKYLF